MARPMPVGDDISALADWVELRVARDSDGLALARLDRLLKAEGSELADEELEDAEGDVSGDEGDEREVELGAEAEAAAEVDVRVELIRQEIDMRAALGARVYPFSAAGGRARRREVCGADVYLLLLVLGTPGLPYRRQRRAHEVEETYDLIALAALKRFLGRGSQGLRFARTARDEDEGPDEEPENSRRRPTSFPRAIKWLRDWLNVGEGVRAADTEPDTITHWEDDEEEPQPLGREPLTSYNDAGVDVIVWWRFADGRAGFPVMLAQCTVQLAWERKLYDVDLDMWQKWIDFHTVPPQKALVIHSRIPATIRSGGTARRRRASSSTGCAWWSCSTSWSATYSRA